MTRCILITCVTLLDFLKVRFGSFVELEWMELIVGISRSKGKLRAGFFVIIINQGAKAPRKTLASTLFRYGIQLARTNSLVTIFFNDSFYRGQ